MVKAISIIGCKFFSVRVRNAITCFLVGIGGFFGCV